MNYESVSARERAAALRLIRPLEDKRWHSFVQKHPRSSVFHSLPWLSALKSTYNLEPVAYTTAAAGEEMRDAFLACRVDSWATGRRMVSLPFSDHCAPLVTEPADLELFIAQWSETIRDQKLRYLEIRPLEPLALPESNSHSSFEYAFHQIDLAPDLDTLFKSFHKDSIQRKIKRADREGLIYEEGQSKSLLQDFCRLNYLTRRRHQIPPQPTKWFENLAESFGEDLKIRVAYKDKQAAAAILTLRYKDTLVYKYGASDGALTNLGGTHLLFWKAIQDAKADGLRTFDLGRSAMDNEGLITFKDRWGAARSTLKYSRFVDPLHPKDRYTTSTESQWYVPMAKRVLARMPDAIFALAGNLIYRHIG